MPDDRVHGHDQRATGPAGEKPCGRSKSQALHFIEVNFSF